MGDCVAFVNCYRAVDLVQRIMSMRVIIDFAVGIYAATGGSFGKYSSGSNGARDLWAVGSKMRERWCR